MQAVPLCSDCAAPNASRKHINIQDKPICFKDGCEFQANKAKKLIDGQYLTDICFIKNAKVEVELEQCFPLSWKPNVTEVKEILTSLLSVLQFAYDWLHCEKLTPEVHSQWEEAREKMLALCALFGNQLNPTIHYWLSSSDAQNSWECLMNQMAALFQSQRKGLGYLDDLSVNLISELEPLWSDSLFFFPFRSWLFVLFQQSGLIPTGNPAALTHVHCLLILVVPLMRQVVGCCPITGTAAGNHFQYHLR
ncbi:hypothetical protein Pelo_15680 [Pelomyxa schiedti]|nr:hypothetical protein Pelo_15680 [Pelomyxa schiedti]